MAATVERSEALLLSEYGLEPKGRIHRNPSTAMLYTHALADKEGVLAEGGPLVVDTGVHTGRSPKDKFIVRERGSEDRIWWGDVNKPLDEENFFGLRDKVVAYLNVQPVLYVVDAFAGADPAQRIGVRVITDRAYHALFAKTLFIEPTRRRPRHLRGRRARAPRAGARGGAARRTARAAARSSRCTRRARRC